MRAITVEEVYEAVGNEWAHYTQIRDTVFEAIQPPKPQSHLPWHPLKCFLEAKTQSIAKTTILRYLDGLTAGGYLQEDMHLYRQTGKKLPRKTEKETSPLEASLAFA